MLDKGKATRDAHPLRMKFWITPSGKQSRLTEVLAECEKNLGLVLLKVDEDCQLLFQDLLFYYVSCTEHMQRLWLFTTLKRTKKLDLIES